MKAKCTHDDVEKLSHFYHHHSTIGLCAEPHSSISSHCCNQVQVVATHLLVPCVSKLILLPEYVHVLDTTASHHIRTQAEHTFPTLYSPLLWYSASFLRAFTKWVWKYQTPNSMSDTAQGPGGTSLHTLGCEANLSVLNSSSSRHAFPRDK